MSAVDFDFIAGASEVADIVTNNKQEIECWLLGIQTELTRLVSGYDKNIVYIKLYYAVADGHIRWSPYNNNKTVRLMTRTGRLVTFPFQVKELNDLKLFAIRIVKEVCERQTKNG